MAFRLGLALIMLWPLLAFPGLLAEAIVFPDKPVERILPEYRSLPVLASDVPLARLLAGQPAGELFLRLLHVKRDHVPDKRQPAEPEAKTKVWAALRGDHVWVHFRCDEPAMGKLVARKTDHDTGVYDDDCVEVALDTANAKLGYFHIVVSSAGTVWDAVEYPPVYCEPSWESGVRVRVSKEASAWTATLEIPFEKLGVWPGTGDLWGIN
ncbi:MAG: hypothetical protein QF473_14565, partial [Planctomycetota bacterium]|nr:hypothetical protein [Planctomycetota bacterium]